VAFKPPCCCSCSVGVNQRKWGIFVLKGGQKADKILAH
jgi:hypothetical protein